jgi:hypothetical protein
MRRSLLVTAILLIVAWLLMLSYQIFTKTALTTIASGLGGYSSASASALSSNINIAAFVCSFAWMFVLSSVISGLIFGQQKRIFIQFLIGLILTVTASAIFDGFKIMGYDLSNPNTLLSNPFAKVLGNGALAFFYLALPFIFMIAVDLRAMTKQRKK